MTLNSVEYDFVSELEKFPYKKLIYVYTFSYQSQVINFTVLFSTDKRLNKENLVQPKFDIIVEQSTTMGLQARNLMWGLKVWNIINI